MSAYELVLERLADRVDRRGDESAEARCPAHEDRNASLSVKTGDVGALVHCHAGCSPFEVAAALGLTMHELFDPPPFEAKPAWTLRGLAATGARVGDDGRVELGGVRYLPGAPGPQKTRATPGVAREPWPAPESIPGPVLWVLEGEPDAQTAHELGLPAVGLPGASKWDDAWAARLAAGRSRIVVLADSDEPGRRHAERVAAALHLLVDDVQVLDLAPAATDGRDLSDWLGDTRGADALGEARAQLERLAGEGQADALRFLTLDELEQLPPARYLIDGVVPDAFVALYGESGAGKTFVAVDWACHVATGVPWMGRSVLRGTVAYLAGEGARGLPKRVRAWEDDRGAAVGERLRILPIATNIMDRAEQARLAAALRRLDDVRVIFVDTVARHMPGGDENGAMDMGLFIDGVVRLAAVHASASVVVHHSGKDVSRGMRGSGSLYAASDAVVLVKGDGTATTLTCEKQKDDEAFRPIALRLERHLGSLVARSSHSHARLGQHELDLLAAVPRLSQDGRATASVLMATTGMTRSTFYRVQKRLETQGFLQEVEGVKPTAWRLTFEGAALAVPTSPNLSHETAPDPFPTSPTPLGVGRRDSTNGTGRLDDVDAVVRGAA